MHSGVKISSKTTVTVLAKRREAEIKQSFRFLYDMHLLLCYSLGTVENLFVWIFCIYLLLSCWIFHLSHLIKTITKFSNVIGYQQPDLSINWTVAHVMLVIGQYASFFARICCALCWVTDVFFSIHNDTLKSFSVQSMLFSFLEFCHSFD